MSQSTSTRLVLIWTAILATVIAAMWMQSLRSDDEESDSSGAQESAEVAPIGLQSELAGKIVVVMSDMRASAPTLTPSTIMESAEPLSRVDAPFADRLAYAVLLGRVAGWDDGVDALRALEPANDAERELRDAVLTAMVLRVAADALDDADTAADTDSITSNDTSNDTSNNTSNNAGNNASTDAIADAETQFGEVLADETREMLAQKLGFFARVLLDDPGIAKESLTLIIVGVCVLAWYAIAFLCGLAALIYALFMLWRTPVAVASSDADSARATLILGETFAIWMVLFLGMNVGSAFLGGALVDALGLRGSPQATSVALACSTVGFFGSLVALVYPGLRGLRGTALRSAIGLHAGRGVMREIAHGVLCYLSAVPLLLGGLIIFAILNAIVTTIFGEASQPSHPVTELYAGADTLRIALTFLIAAVAAPIVEEIAFRGVLYGHLRATVFPRIHFASIVVAAVVSSFIFAVIHPQGVLFTPALGGLAVGFCIFRELRGSLIAPMVAHSINNAVTLTIGLLLLA
jgi:membrane protease YdiL (CAAX protease family)